MKRGDLNFFSFYFLIIDMETEEIMLSKVVADGLLIKPGDNFLSKVTGKLVMCCDADADHSRASCAKCVYNSKENFPECSGCSSYIHSLRLVEAGHCTPHFRKDNKNVYFKEVESLYEIPSETISLLKTISYSDMTPLDKFKCEQLLLEALYVSYLTKRNGGTRRR